MIPNSRKLMTDAPRRASRFSFSHADYQRMDDEASVDEAAVSPGERQRPRSRLLFSNTTRKPRPKSLPVASGRCTSPSRDQKNPLTRSLSALMQRFRKRRSAAVPLPVPESGLQHDPRQACTTLSASCRDPSNDPSIQHTHTAPFARGDTAKRCSVVSSSVYSTFPTRDEEDGEELCLAPATRTSAISVQKQHHTTAYVTQMQSECISPHDYVMDSQPQAVATDHHGRQGNLAVDDEEADSAIGIESIREVAERLWDDNDTSICCLDERAEWLGTSDRFRAQVLKHYMNHFDFSGQRLDTAFRTLCGKLYFKAEAQQMDRILEAFARRYWNCYATAHGTVNAQRTLGSADVVYTVAYAILLLNTDLHVVHQEKGRRKMSQSKFVRNTMATIRDLELPPGTTTTTSCFSLSAHCASKQKTPLLPASESTISALSSSNISSSGSSGNGSLWPLQRSTSITSNACSYDEHPFSRRWTYYLDIADRMGPKRRDRLMCKSSITSAQRAWLVEMEALLKEIYMSIRSRQIAQSSRAITQPRYPPPQHAPGVKPELRMYGGRKEGLLTRKHVMESHNKRARQRGWQLCRVVVHNGTMCLYVASPASSVSTSSSASSSSSSSGLQAWDSHRNVLGSMPSSRQQRCARRPRALSSTIVTSTYQRMASRSSSSSSSSSSATITIDLKHSLATAMPQPGWHRSHRQHVFCLKCADGAIWLFETLTADAAHEWANVCNYWAARLSKEPLDGAVCNLDYGWGTGDGVRGLLATAPVHDWHPPPAPCNIGASCLSTSEQLAMLQRRIHMLEQELDQHREFKDRIYHRFLAPSLSSQRKKALDNWEHRAQYLIHEVIKMHTYHDTLLRFYPCHPTSSMHSTDYLSES